MRGRGSRRRKAVRDPHLLYSAAVQSVDADLDFLERVYARRNETPFRLLREDFCGTAALACEWVRRGIDHHAWGVDLHRPTLAWSREHYVPRLGGAATRLHLLCRDVRRADAPRVDVVAALNFSYQVFKTRADLGRYFAQVRRSLRPGGMFFLDALGGTETATAVTERRRIAASTAFDGTAVPAFTYVWEQARFNPVDHAFVCHIHFHLGDGTRLRRAFTYEWRLWTLPELRELLAEAGFESSEVYVEGWDQGAEEGDGIFRRRTAFENDAGWIAYVVGLT
jgi:SAM-dependent methyltransferase